MNSSKSRDSFNKDNVLYIGNLPPKCERIDIDYLLTESHLDLNVTAMTITTAKTGKKYAYMQLGSPEEVRKAAKVLHLQDIHDSVISASAFGSQKQKANDKCMVFVKNIGPESTEVDVLKAMQQFARVKAITFKKIGRGTSSIVTYGNPIDAEMAVERLNKTELGNRKLMVTKYMSKEEQQIKFQLTNDIYISSVSQRIPLNQVKKIFLEYGTISKFELFNGALRGLPFNFGMVTYDLIESASDAYNELSKDKQIEGEPFIVELWNCN